MEVKKVSSLHPSIMGPYARVFFLSLGPDAERARAAPRVSSYDTRILRKTHVPVSDTVSDTRTPRILPDTYPVSLGLFRYFQIIKINRISWDICRYLSDTFKP